MSSLEGRQVSAIKSALAAANGAGSYHYDLSVAGRVIVGRLLMQHLPEPPFASVYSVGVTVEHGEPLGMYTHRHRVGILIVVPAGDEPETRHLAALNACADVRRALEADRTLGDTCFDLIVATTPDPPELWEDPIPGVASSVEVNLFIHRVSGDPS